MYTPNNFEVISREEIPCDNENTAQDELNGKSTGSVIETTTFSTNATDLSAIMVNYLERVVQKLDSMDEYLAKISVYMDKTARDDD